MLAANKLNMTDSNIETKQKNTAILKWDILQNMGEEKYNITDDQVEEKNILFVLKYNLGFSIINFMLKP